MLPAGRGQQVSACAGLSWPKMHIRAMISHSKSLTPLDDCPESERMRIFGQHIGPLLQVLFCPAAKFTAEAEHFCDHAVIDF